jgi:hypothetical protein
MRTDEITDASERVPLPMCNNFSYELQADGHLYFQDQQIGNILDAGLEKAREIAAHDPTFFREYLHREIERDEYDEQRRLALGGNDDPDILVVASPQVKEIGKRLTMVRIYQRTEAGITATSISFDRADHDALDAIAHLFGQKLQDDETPEETLSRRLTGYSSQFGGDIRQAIARAYDAVLEAKHGGAWSGGRQGADLLDAQSFILSQEDLLGEHLLVIESLKKRGASENDMELARYNFAAALGRRLRGEADAASMDAAGESDRQQGIEHDNSCPTGNMQSATQSLEQLGMQRREWKHGSCRNCLDVYNPQQIVGECDVCRHCENADNKGQMQDVASRARSITETLKASSRSTKVEASNAPVAKEAKRDSLAGIKKRFGEFALIRSEISWGGTNQIVYDKRTNEVITQL